MSSVGMDESVGVACGQCDTYSSIHSDTCPACGHDLSMTAEFSSAGLRRKPTAPHARAKRANPASVPEEDKMEQARNYVCKQCSTPVTPNQKFCGRCGAPVPEHVLKPSVNFFGTMQAPGKARLALIRGEGNVDGLSYLLQGDEHVAGRKEGQILFPEDAWLSPRHANFVYKKGSLVVRDENSLNGIYMRIRQPVTISASDQFICGEQMFTLQTTPKDDSGPGPDMTYFYASPKKPSSFRIVQILRGGGAGMVYCARESSVQIGRDGGEMNFPDDIFMSANHAKIEVGTDGRFTLVDNGSKNGTYLKLREETELHHGDYVFLGKQLLRVEINA